MAGYLLLILAIPILNSVRILVWSPDFFQAYELLSNYCLLLVGPLLYLYTRNRINNKILQKADRLHFLPFIGLFSLQLLSQFFLLDGLSYLTEIIGGLLMIVSMSTYQFLAIRLVNQKAQAHEKSFLITIYGFAVVWHINLLIQVSELFADNFKEEYQIAATLLLSILVLILCYAHWIDLFQPLKTNKTSIQLKPAKAQMILSKIKQTMQQQKPYLEKGFTLQKLSRQLEEPSSYVSYLINKEYEMSFPKYVAHLRIKEFVARSKETKNNHFSIQGMSQEVGFNSASTFNKAFKENMNMLPSKFIKTLKTA